MLPQLWHIKVKQNQLLKKYADEVAKALSGMTTEYEGYGLSYAEAIGLGFNGAIGDIFSGIRNELQKTVKQR